VLGRPQLRIAGHDRLGLRPGLLQQLGVLGQAGHLEVPEARLARAGQLALAAQLEVDLGEAEPVGVGDQRA
jgi:hypothetical protein